MKTILCKIFSASFGLVLSSISLGAEAESKQSDLFAETDPYRIQLIHDTVYQNSQNSFNNATLNYLMWQRLDQTLYLELDPLYNLNGLHGPLIYTRSHSPTHSLKTEPPLLYHPHLEQSANLAAEAEVITQQEYYPAPQFMNIDPSPYRIQLINGTFYQNPQKSFNNATLWLPMWQRSDKVLYLELNQLNSFDGIHNSGVNAGFRWLNADQSWLFGAHTGYSVQNSDMNNNYQQLSLGAEIRNQDWHGYGNVYLPVGHNQYNETLDYWQAVSSSNSELYNILFKQNQEKALTGGDLNLGYTVWKPMNARLYVGGYYYAASGVQTISGPRAQFQIDLYNAFDRFGHSTFLNRISLDTMVQHDNVYKTNWYGGVTFAFTLGKQQSLSGLQQYMQVATPQNNAMAIRPNDAQNPTVFNNADGSPLTIGYADDATSLNHAVSNDATVIAVRGNLQNIDTTVLKDNQTLTGGNYTLSNGLNFALGNNGQITAAAGKDLLQVSKNNLIENITLNADSDQHVIVNDLASSYGTLTVNNVTATAGVQLKITDGSQDSHLQFTNNTINMGNVTNDQALKIIINSGKSEFNISDNTFAFGNGNGNEGIELTSDITGSDRTFNIDAIDNNVISFLDGSQNAGMRLNVVDNTGFSGNMTVSSLKNNNIIFATGNNNYALNANMSSFSNNGSMTLNNLVSNHVSYISGTNNSGFYVYAGVVGNGAIVLNTVSGNNISLPSSGNNQGFQLLAGTDATDSLTVNVNADGQGLSAANNNTSVVTDGNTTVNPTT